MLKGGYIIINLKDFEFTSDNYTKIDGIYNTIKNNFDIGRKEVIISGLIYKGNKYADISVSIYKKNTSYYANIVTYYNESDTTSTKYTIDIKITQYDNVSIEENNFKSPEDSDVNDRIETLTPLKIFKHTTGANQTDIQILDHMIFIKPYSPIIEELGTRTLTEFYTEAELAKIAEYFSTENDISVTVYGVTSLSVTIDIDTGTVTINNSSQVTAINGIYSGTIVI